jgi:hydroxymethylbilane synthase
LAQTHALRGQLAAALGAEADTALPFQAIVTTGDRIQDRRLGEAGGKGLFTKELDEALLAGEIDLAVHSLKDLPTRLPEGIALVAVTARLDARDGFLSPHAPTLDALPAGAILGTASLRRQAQALFVRPDLQIVTLRGNVDTRMRKLADGMAHATFLALAGLKRLGLADRVTSILDPFAFPPAAGQGALAVTARAGDAAALATASLIADPVTSRCAAVERGFLDALDGSCRTAIGAYAAPLDGEIRFVGEVLTPDGTQRWRAEGVLPLDADPAEATELGARLGLPLRGKAS